VDQHGELAAQGPVVVLILLLFPDSRMPDRRWWPVVWVSVLGILLAEPGWALGPGTGSVFVGRRNPFAVRWLPTGLMFYVGFSLLAVAMVAVLVASVVRFRRSGPVERQQLKWFAFASVFLVVALPTAALLWNSAPVVRALPPPALTAGWSKPSATPNSRPTIVAISICVHSSTLGKPRARRRSDRISNRPPPPRYGHQSARSGGVNDDGPGAGRWSKRREPHGPRSSSRAVNRPKVLVPSRP